MVIKIKLTKAEEKGIKDYLKDVDGLEKPTKEDVTRFVEAYVNTINAPQESVSDYIRKYQTQEQL